VGLERRALIRAATKDELPAIASFVAALQARPEDRIGYFGDTPEEIAALLASWGSPWFASARLVERRGAIVGFAAAELDESLGRAWVHGPLVGDSAWDELADELFRELLAIAPPAIEDFELLGDVANVRLARLAERHGFTAGAVNHVLGLDATGIQRLPNLSAPGLSSEHERAFVELHDTLFPATYYPGPTLLERSARGESVIVAIADSVSLIAYAAGQIDEVGAGYIDFVGVAPEKRREGRGRTVVVALTRALDDRQRIPSVRLVVSSTNEPALALYDSLGFERVSSMVGYRRRPEIPS
jgi:ribosomal protein S18 acetylase RimI-like enzyme